MASVNEWSPVSSSSSSDILEETRRRLRERGLDVEAPAHLAEFGADLVVTVGGSTGALRYLLFEYKPSTSEGYIPSGVVSSSASQLRHLRQFLRPAETSCYLVTNRKLGAAASSLSSDLEIPVIPEVSSGEQFAHQVLRIVDDLQESA